MPEDVPVNLSKYLHIRASAPPLGLAFIALILAVTCAWFNWIIPFIIFCVAVGVLVADALARTKEYWKLRQLLQSGRSSSALRQSLRMKGSWCQRHAATQASLDAGCDPWLVFDYNILGYRWYHFFPDGTFTLNSPFLSCRWWYHLVCFWKSDGKGGRA